MGKRFGRKRSKANRRSKEGPWKRAVIRTARNPPPHFDARGVVLRATPDSEEVMRRHLVMLDEHRDRTFTSPYVD